MTQVDFIGLGAAKSGTTWLAKCLGEHPQICMSHPKELNFFSRTRAFNTNSEYEKLGVRGYTDLFKHCPTESVKGEFSTHYLPDPRVAAIIKKHFPKVKLIVALRDPVERAYSDYLNNKLLNLSEKEDFEKAFFERNNSYYDNYLQKGEYYKQLKVYFDLFPRSQIKVILFDDIKNKSKEVVKDLYKFVGVDPNFVPDALSKKSNESSATRFLLARKFMNKLSDINHTLERKGFGKFLAFVKRKFRLGSIYWYLNEKNRMNIEKSKLDKQTEKKLKKVYLEDITKLEKLIHRNLSNWK